MRFWSTLLLPAKSKWLQIKGKLKWRCISYHTFGYMKWFERRSSEAVQQLWPEVSSTVWSFFGSRRQPWRRADWGQAESILRLPISAPRVLPGAGLRTAHKHGTLGAVRKLWRWPVEVQECFVLTCSLLRGSCFGGGVLLRGMGRQRLHAPHRGAVWTAAESVTYAGTREEAHTALIKTCWVNI